MTFLNNIFTVSNPEQKAFSKSLKILLGYKTQNTELFKVALTHSSVSNASNKLNNERLEFLGDAVLGLVVAEMLYNKYAFENEGFLTEMRAKIVNGTSLNQIARKIGLHEMILLNTKNNNHLANNNKYIYGDALEAIIGAIYIDKGDAEAKDFVRNKIVNHFVDFGKLENTINNYKSVVLEWASKNGKLINFIIKEETVDQNRRLFAIDLLIENEVMASGLGSSKKEGEQLAAESFYNLYIRNKESAA